MPKEYKGKIVPISEADGPMFGVWNLKSGGSVPSGIVLAIDPGSSCGWALGPFPGGGGGSSPIHASRGLVKLAAGGGAIFGVWNLKPGRGESPGVRYLRLRARLEETKAAAPNLGLVVYEQAHHRGGYATEYAIGCSTTIQAWAAERGVEHASAHRGRVLRHAMSKGAAAKETVVRLACLRYACESLSDDEADALFTLEWALHEFSGRG